jgi:hypothetical protein
VPAEEYWTVRMTAAATLLLANYELTDEELGSLLVWETDDRAADERWDRIDEAILGVVPKPAPATDTDRHGYHGRAGCSAIYHGLGPRTRFRCGGAGASDSQSWCSLTTGPRSSTWSMMSRRSPWKTASPGTAFTALTPHASGKQSSLARTRSSPNGRWS